MAKGKENIDFIVPITVTILTDENIDSK